MPYGQRMGSIKKLKASLKKGGMGQIRWIPKNGSITVRFLEEPENWVNYAEHWDAVRSTTYPCIDGNGVCPGCSSDARKTSRYLANALNVEDDRVIALQLPMDLTKRLVAKYERTDTMMDRDYTLTRDGEGLETTYDYDAEPPLNRKLTKYQPLDLEAVLDDVVKATLGADADDDDDDEDEGQKLPVKRPTQRTKSAAAKSVQAKHDARAAVVEEDDEDDEDDEPVAPARKFKSPPARAQDDDDDEDEDDDEVEDDDEDIDVDDEDEELEDDEDNVLTEEDMQAMAIGELRTIAKEAGYDPSGLKKAEIIEMLIEGDDTEDDDEEVDEDEEPF